MKCPFCGNPDSKVIDSRSAESGQVIRRRRECKNCKRRFTTFERFEQFPVAVVKRNGDKESYKREKILKGLRKAFEKRPVTSQQIEELASKIESELRAEGKEAAPYTFIELT